ncbi:hypothetical protein DERP_001549 [Dermatophagoides pteronyssinus]|uniref:Uncharacterized protein n=1 Tax=Dermatophagoides pteronyssinus TaxID=6956 RepID=A0ABQ8JAX4_DERPT|nr:hypothetical protein DERP_001549 [Dermatophagoides pteronyssinus]
MHYVQGSNVTMEFDLIFFCILSNKKQLVVMSLFVGVGYYGQPDLSIIQDDHGNYLAENSKINPIQSLRYQIKLMRIPFISYKFFVRVQWLRIRFQ